MSRRGGPSGPQTTQAGVLRLVAGDGGGHVDAVEAIVARLGDAALAVDEGLMVRAWSAGAERLLGWSADEVMGRPFLTFVDPALGPDEVVALRDRLFSEGTRQERGPRRRKDGTRFLAETWSVVLRDPSGAPTGALCVLREAGTPAEVPSPREASAPTLQEARLQQIFQSLSDAVAAGGEPYLHALLRDLGDHHHLDSEARRLGGLVRQMSEAVVVLDAAFRITEFTGAAERLLGLSREEALGRSVVSDLTVVLEDAEAPELRRRVAERQGVQGRARVRRADGRWVELEVSLTPLHPSGPAAGAWLAVARDVAGKRAVSEAAQETTDRLRTVVASMAEGVVLQESNGRLAFWNAAAERILGVPRRTIPGGPTMESCWDGLRIWSPFPGNDHPAMVSLRTGRPLTGVILGARRPDGGPVWLSLNLEPIRSEPGGPVRAVAVTFTDITSHRELVLRLKDNELRLRHALDGSADGVLDWAAQGDRLSLGGAVAAFLGEPDGSLPPTRAGWLQRLHPEEEPIVTEQLRQLRLGVAERLDLEYRVRRRDGSYGWVRERSKVVELTTTGHARRISGTLTDIDTTKQAQLQLEAAFREKERLVEELQEALQQVKTLTGLLPICMHCHKIRNDQGYWDRLEKYFTDRTGVLFSHGLCPSCHERYYPPPPGECQGDCAEGDGSGPPLPDPSQG